MNYYQATVTLAPEFEDFAKDVCQPCQKISPDLTEENYLASNKTHYIFISRLKEGTIILGIVTKAASIEKKIITAFIQSLELKPKDFEMSEIGFKELYPLLKKSIKNRFLEDEREVLMMLGLNEVAEASQSSRYCYKFEDKIISNKSSKASLIKAAKKLLCADALVAEVNRIFATKATQQIQGHPVHYLIQAANQKSRDEISDIILTALYATHRIASQRYSSLTISPTRSLASGNYEQFYDTCEHGALVVSIPNSKTTERDNCLEQFIQNMACRKDKTLTIVALNEFDDKAKQTIQEKLASVTFVEINEEMVSAQKARAYLTQLAKDSQLSSDDELFDLVPTDDKVYLSADLLEGFAIWKDKKIRTEIYPQYATIRKVSEKKFDGKAYKELTDLIGLKQAKETMKQILEFDKLQKLFPEKKGSGQKPALNMIFTGNPGTAKTTVARLYAQILKENGILSKGELYEVGRSDLVAGYVGQTAIKVKKQFEKAKGSVLFIDEAYSLVDDRSNSFGDEAINTIVQEMENNRGEMVVIFAGYPENMAHFLETNPGLRSRIPYHVRFDDYDATELKEIAQLLATQKHQNLTKEAQDKLDDLFETVSHQKDFGNGRFVRNLLEKAELKQASRLIAYGVEKLCEEDLTTFVAEDFETPQEMLVCQEPIGFFC